MTQHLKQKPAQEATKKPRRAPRTRAAIAKVRAHIRRETIAVAGIIITAGLLWLSGNVFWSRIAVGNALVPAVVGDARLEALIDEQVRGHRVTLRYPDGKTRMFSLHELGMRPDIAASVAATRRAQDAPLHWLTWWRPVPTDLVVRTDETMLRSFITTHATIVVKQPKNAEIKLENGKVTVTPGADGRQYGFTNPTRSILAGARSLQSTPLQLTTVARGPERSTESLREVKIKIEHILAQKISVQAGDKTVHPDTAQIANWLQLEPLGKTISIRLDQEKLKGYLNTVAEEQTKDPRSKVISNATGAVLVEGSNGAKVTNTVTVDEKLAANILAARGEEFTLAVKTTPFRTVNAPTAGKWIEVDTTTKRMWAYDQGEVVRSFLVSAGAPGTPTVTGTFAIYSKIRSQDMQGLNSDGSRYFQPDVPYVNYFYRDYAIHGNYWRPGGYFGYINSSHGCVGTTVNDGAWIYSWAPVGTPVIVHT
jgi:lipoprotein-anchoring transpeptidase ErfK/SrfK